MKIRGLTALPALLVASAAMAQDTARMDEIVQSFVSHGKFMGTVLVSKGDQVLLNKGYGSANIEWDIPNTPDTKFRLGSLTKQFTAAAVLLLEERGKLSIGDPVRKYMPDAPAAWDKITLFNLLTHTSGIQDFTTFSDLQEKQVHEMSPEQLVAWFRDKPLDFEPGTRMKYSNSGYVLLGYLIEKVSGEKYEDFLQENIFGPLGMRDSGYDSNTRIILRRASGYVPGPKALANAGYVHMSVPFSAGALYSTTGDLLKWETGLFGGKLLSPASLAKMTTPFLDNYAFGLFITDKYGGKQIVHNGGIDGFNTFLGYDTASRTTVAVLGNQNGGAPDEIGSMLIKLANGEEVVLPTERKAIDLPAEKLKEYVGTYEFEPGMMYLITLDDGRLMGRLGAQQAFPLFAERPDFFFLKVVDAQIEVVRDAKGTITGLILHQGGRDHPIKWVSSEVKAPPVHKEISLPAEALRKFVGTYRLSPAAELKVTLENGQLGVQLTGQQRFAIFPETENSFFLRVVEAQLEFVIGPSGVDSVILHQNGRDQNAPREP